MFMWKRGITKKTIQDVQIYSPKVIRFGDPIPSITLQDFPIRGHKVFLHVKRRRWLNTTTGKVVHREWNEVAEGTRMTSEFSAFLKAVGGYEG